MMRTGLICCYLMAAIGLSAQEVKFSVEISNDTVLLGNYFELKYTIEGTSAKKFEAPDFDGLTILGGPNTSTSISIVNGEMSQSASYTYYLQPMDIGNYVIPPAYLDTGNGEIETPPLEVIVVPNPDGIEQVPGRAGKKYEEVQPAPESKRSKSKRPRRKI